MSRAARFASTLVGPIALALAGATLALLPHLLNLWNRGDAVYIADGDQLLYTAWSRDAVLDGAWHLSDAVHPVVGPMMHPWLLFVPVARLAHALGADTLSLPLFWRAIGGAGVALGLYAALRPMFADRRLALGVAAILTFDPGFLFGRPFVHDFDVLTLILSGSNRYFDGPPRLMAHLRVVPPSAVLPLLLALFGLAARGRLGGSVRHWAAAGLCLGLLFYLYFYLWTALVGTLVLAVLLDPRARRGYLTALLLGLAIGLPSVIHSASVKAGTPPDWLHRTEKFVRVPRLEDPFVPKLIIAVWLAATPLVFTRRRELMLPWCGVLASLACANHRLLTGLQVENFHWLIPAGASCSVLVTGIAAPWIFEPRRDDAQVNPAARPRLALLMCWLVFQVSVGLICRAAETTRPAETRRWTDVYDRLRADDLPVPKNAVLAGDPDAVMLRAALYDNFAMAGKFVEYCATVTDDEFDERLMLNFYLRGFDRASARREVEQPPGTLSWESLAVHSPAAARVQRERRLALIDRIWAEPADAAARFGVSHVVLPADSPSPADALGHVGPAHRLALGRFWQLWEVSPTPPLVRPSARL